MLFTIPVGGGIPAGVLLAQERGIGWPWMMLLYFFSDLALALVFEPILLALSRLATRVAWLSRMCTAFRQSMERSAARFGHVTGPFSLVMIAFGVDPMTGRAAALAAGYEFVGGWMIAIAGDMIYFTVLLVCTLWLKERVGDGTVVMLIILTLMIVGPLVVKKLRELWRRRH